MATAVKKNNGSVDMAQELVERHQRLIKEYDVKSGAPKAQVSQRIVDCEYELEMIGAAYEPWIKPSSYARKWTMTETELVERIVKARAIAIDPDKRDVIRERATKDLDKLTDQASKRGVEIPAS
jgi:hypothetical protein